MKRVVRQIGFVYYTNKYRMCLLKYFYFVFTDFIVVVKFVCGSHDIHNFIDIVRFDNEVAVEYHFFQGLVFNGNIHIECSFQSQSDGFHVFLVEIQVTVYPRACIFCRYGL